MTFSCPGTAAKVWSVFINYENRVLHNPALATGRFSCKPLRPGLHRWHPAIHTLEEPTGTKFPTGHNRGKKTSIGGKEKLNEI